MTSADEAAGCQWRSSVPGFFIWSRMIRTRSVTRHSYAGSRSVRASQKMELWSTRRPQNSKSGIVVNDLPNRGSVGSGGNLVTTAAADVHRVASLG